mgnify:CR=1 FL=1|jgi:hypothetical protein|nr:MAG TPA: hypothetical protein [Caudoviricetes sp.]
MLNITSIKSEGKEELKTYKMVINFKPNMDTIDYLLLDCVVQGVTLEYVYSHACSLIPIEPLNYFWESSTTFDSIAYTFKTDLTVLEDLAEHIRILIDDINLVTIHPLDVEEN